MAALPSTPPAGWGICIPAPQTTPTLSAGYVDYSARFAFGSIDILHGSKVVGSPALITHSTKLGNSPSWEWIQDRILVSPRKYDAGLVLSKVEWSVEVWNTHRYETCTQTGFTITGAGSLVLDSPTTDTYTVGQSKVFAPYLPIDGDLTINNVATWMFTGHDPSGTNMAVLGTRITVFPHCPDWSENWKETLSFVTNVLTSWNGSEQRRSLIPSPIYRCEFRVLTTSALESMALDNLIYGWQGKKLGVPWWVDATALSSPATAGTDTIQCDTTIKPAIKVGGRLLIWTDYNSWEAGTIKSFTDSAITLTNPLQQSWPTLARVIPMKIGRTSDSQSINRGTNWSIGDTFSFACEAVE